jgi:hypothetical protein
MNLFLLLLKNLTPRSVSAGVQVQSVDLLGHCYEIVSACIGVKCL